MIKNDFYRQVQELEDQGASADDLRLLLGRGRSKRGIFEGDLSEGELEIGQIASMIREIAPAETVVKEMVGEYNETVRRLKGITVF